MRSLNFATFVQTFFFLVIFAVFFGFVGIMKDGQDFQKGLVRHLTERAGK